MFDHYILGALIGLSAGLCWGLLIGKLLALTREPSPND